MPGKSRSHSEQSWASQPEHVIRCGGTLRSGTRCKRVANVGTNVCNLHGGGAPQVRQAAAERIGHSTASAAEAMLAAMINPSVPWGVRVKIVQDVLDRGGLAAAQTHRLVLAENDPVESLFQALLSDPANLDGPPSDVVRGELVESSPDPAQDAVDRLEQSWQPDAEVTPLRPDPADYGPVGPHATSPPSNSKVPRHIREG